MAGMNRFILLLGGNQGDRFGTLFEAINRLSVLYRVTGSSPVYLTEPWGMKEQPWFLNACLTIDSELSPIRMLEELQTLETAMGRTRTVKWGPRTLDIDILACGELIYVQPGLEIPHPGLSRRRFALEPMAAVEPEWKHPVEKWNVKEYLAALVAPEKVIRL
ncbi:MAG: 2-amino-4-hydroxy-6-hydroxymethyldihydropteridine diphosphokinase [Bacteroidia bacterium]|nr:2-amino-4-hydroxy-6-hydroxymethyldihydropteridine diphosphokinase [Bacteroidia bacterium]